MLSEYIQKILLAAFLFIRYTGFKGGKDLTYCIVRDCIRPASLTLSMWHNSLCSKESKVSSEQISFQDLGYVAV